MTGQPARLDRRGFPAPHAATGTDCSFRVPEPHAIPRLPERNPASDSPSLHSVSDTPCPGAASESFRRRKVRGSQQLRTFWAPESHAVTQGDSQVAFRANVDSRLRFRRLDPGLPLLTRLVSR